MWENGNKRKVLDVSQSMDGCSIQFHSVPPPKKKIKKWLGTTIRLVLKGRGFEEVRILYWFNLYTTIHVHALYPVCILYLDHG